MHKPLCVVLGGSGFLGQRLCPTLLAEGFRVRSVSRSGKPQKKPEPWWADMEWIAAAMGTEASISALQGAQCLVHLASTTLPSTSNADIVYDLESNVVGTVRILEAAVSLGVRRVLFVSSGGTVYGISRQNPIPEDHPTSPVCSYGVHKLAIEKYLQLFHFLQRLDSVILRVSNMYGESQDCSKPLGAITHFATRAVCGMPIEIWGDGTTIRDYIHVDDVACAISRALLYEGADRLFNIGSSRGVSLNEVVELLRQRLHTTVTVNYQPRRSFDVPENVLEISRAKRELPWRPAISLESGLERMIRAVQATGCSSPSSCRDMYAVSRPLPDRLE